MAIINNVRKVMSPSIGRIPLADKAGSFTPSGTKREHKGGRIPEDGGHLDTSVPAKLELSVNLLGNIDVTRFNSIVDEDVTVQLADGQVHLLSKAFCTEPVQVSDGEGKLTIMANFSERIS
jgi:hypothetical protein